MDTARKWQRAASFAADRHRHHLRKDGRTPYVAHVYRVAMTVRDIFGCDDDDALAAALLHDTIEDTPTDFDDIEKRFGAAVAEMVAALTKNMILREDEREADYDARLSRADWRARLVKLADVFDNLSDLHNRPAADLAAFRRMESRCERAIALALPDESREPVRRGIEAVRELVEQARARFREGAEHGRGGRGTPAG
ncbi:MAG TPA: HD domain-containing protein [Phycisphaerales bacterium]|nr:HD domain-containing protein [Phycisphaerales bacterium]